MTTYQELFIDEAFQQGLSITKFWCETQLDKDTSAYTLRPSELSPLIDIRDYNVDIHHKKEEIKRLNLIKAIPFKNQDLVLSNIHGKILVFYPELSLNDGLMGMESEGFIDEDDCPP